MKHILFFSERTFYAALKILQISPQQFADNCGISYMHLRRIVSGRSSNIAIMQEIRNTTYRAYKTWERSKPMVERDIDAGWEKLNKLKEHEQIYCLRKMVPECALRNNVSLLANMTNAQQIKWLKENFEEQISEYFLSNPELPE